MTEPERRGVWASAYYFLYFAAGASFIPFLVLYYQSRGLSGAQIGTLTALPPLMSLWAGPVWAGLADARRRHRMVFTLATMGVATMAVLLGRSRGYWVLLACATAYSILVAPVVSLADNAVVGTLRDRSDRYGKIRLWGSVGWGISAPLTGVVVGRGGLGWVFWIFGSLLLLSLVASTGFPLSTQRPETRFLAEVRRLLENRRWLAFLFLALVAGVGLAGVNYYLFPYLERLGASRGLMGVSLTIATVSELPVFFLVGALLKKRGARMLLIVAIASIALRDLLYAVIQAPWVVLLVQLLHGPSFSLLWGAGVAYARECAPPGLGATAQGMFGAMVMGVGRAVGGYLGGVLLGSVGPWLMYGVYGCVAVVGLAIYLVAERVGTRGTRTA